MRYDSYNILFVLDSSYKNDYMFFFNIGIVIFILKFILFLNIVILNNLKIVVCFKCFKVF